MNNDNQKTESKYNPQLLTFNEAKRFLRINRGTLYKLIRDGSLPAFRVGKLWRIDKFELITWLKNQSIKKNDPVKVEINV